MIKVIIADDQYLIRDGIKSLLSTDPEIAVIGLAADGLEAFKLCQENRPEIVLMDIAMPGCNGIEATRLVKASFPDIKVVILSTFNDTNNIEKALSSGADGYILKDVAPQDLIAALKSSLRDIRVFHKDVLSNITDTIQVTKIPKTPLAVDLSDRELAIIGGIVEGKSNSEIAAELFISEGSLRNAVSVILQKLNLKDRVQLAVFALKNNIA